MILLLLWMKNKLHGATWLGPAACKQLISTAACALNRSDLFAGFIWRAHFATCKLIAVKAVETLYALLYAFSDAL
jgi:hypothetical protein